MCNLKRALCVQDISTIGRCSLTVVLPVLSAMGIQACPLPTALLSSHPLGFNAPVHAEQTSFCNNVLTSYEAQKINFDAVLSGYLSNFAQAQMVQNALEMNKNALKIIDPVMADNGKLYSKSTKELCNSIKNLCHYADIITPNATESAVLLGMPPSDAAMTQIDWQNRLAKLFELYNNTKAIIITGVSLPQNEYANAVLIKNDLNIPKTYFFKYENVNESYPGTGDFFAALLCGNLLLGNDILNSVQNSADFVSKVVLHTFNKKTNKRYGVEFEPFLHLLKPQ